MSAFRITIAGLTYIAEFAGQQQAAEDAERRYPHAWPAQVFCLGRAA